MRYFGYIRSFWRFIFGSSGYHLSLTELQSRACQEVCDGLLKKPKEVFLFGCNTTAGKTRDNRTPEEYTEVLIADGFSRSQAERVSAFRYSSIGEETQDRMRQVFPHFRIYGFHSLAPSGKSIKRRLQGYFKSIVEVHLALAEALEDPSSDVRSAAARVLNRNNFD